MPLPRNERINFQNGDALNGTTQNRIGFKKGLPCGSPNSLKSIASIILLLCPTIRCTSRALCLGDRS